jgi:hypothetical protein
MPCLRDALQNIDIIADLVSAEEVTLSCNFNGLRWLTSHNGAIEPQKLFSAVANRNFSASRPS